MSTKGGNNSNNKKKLTKPAPTAALKRFAADLALDPSSTKFLQINRDRVSQFVGKKPHATVPLSGSKESSKPVSNIPGILDYSFLDKDDCKKRIIQLQNLPEFQSSLGIRSRFGEGDGSFFDQWLNNDVQQSKHVVDKNGLPVLRFSLTHTQSGFKKLIQDSTSPNSTRKGTFFKPYEERRKERLEREAATKSLSETESPDSKSIDTTSATSLPPIQSSPKDSSVVLTNISSEKLPQIDVHRISPVERDNYFGPQARSTFFDYYRSLSRQQLNMSRGNVYERAMQQIDFINLEKRFGDNTLASAMTSNHSENENAKTPELLNNDYSMFESADFQASGRSRSVIEYTPGDDEVLIPTDRSSVPTERETYSRLRSRQKDILTTEHENKVLLTHLAVADQDSAVPCQRPLSARTRFLIGCAARGIYPQPSWIIRRELSTILNVSSLGMGDEVAIILADTIGLLPMLEGLYIADNQLTDVSLVPFINNLSGCSQLKELDISKNKVDSKAAEALRVYLSSTSCNLNVLSMCNANIDDYEASKFMLAIALRHTISDLNLAENLLGSHEVKNAIKRGGSTAGESIGKLLQDQNCSLTRLRLTWNMIRFNSGVALVKAIAVNNSLTSLDVSYNGLAIPGGEALGEALSYNTSLVALNVAHNNLTPRAAFTILSGIRSCPSLREVDISENPIGVGGAMALLSVNLSEGHRLAIDIKGCSLKVQDSTCWFDPSKLDREFVLKLDSPYERAVCIELLRMAAASDEYKIEKYTYIENSESDSVGRDLDFEYGILRRKDSFFLGTNELKSGEGSALYDIASNIDNARNLYRDTFSEVFQRYDTNLSGGLDWREIIVVLNELGLESSLAVVHQLLYVYDVDGSGIIEEEEFINFLMDIKEQRDTKNVFDDQVGRFMCLKDNAASQHPYYPPSKGIVKVAFRVDKIVPEFIRTATKNEVESVFEASKSTADSNVLFSCALNVMRLSYAEALNFFNVMMKDHGNNGMVDVVHKLLPRMASAADSNQLITAITGNDYSKIFSIKQSLGKIYRVYIGIPNGFYSLNLADVNDRTCFAKLVQLSNTFAAQRLKQRKGDTSQNGDFSGFRNVVYNGAPFILTSQWLDAIPSHGKVEFDFVCLQENSYRSGQLSHQRFVRILSSFGMIGEHEQSRSIANIESIEDEGRAAAKANGHRRWEMSEANAVKVSNYLEFLYQTYAQGTRKTMSEMSFSSEEASLIEGERQRILDSQQRMRAEKARLPQMMGSRHSANSTPAIEAAANFITSTEIYGSHIKKMISLAQIDGSNTSNSKSSWIIATRTLDAIESVLSPRYITCAQLNVLTMSFPSGEVQLNEQTTFRVELIVRLFSIITDVINFDFVIKDLTNEEHAMLIFRLGLLNIWNPAKAEGSICLNLRRREERQVVRILLAMKLTERGDTWMQPRFRTEVFAEDKPDWKLPDSWFSESTLPKSGLLHVKYFSGKGVQLNGCAPNPTNRFAFLALVLARPFNEDMGIVFNKKITTDYAESILKDAGCQLSFLTKF